MTLTEFLLARIAEDEAEMAAAIESRYPSGRWTILRNPSRLAAECEAKRRIVEEHRGGKWPNPPDPCDAHDASFVSTPCDTLRYLAAVYADHPDYDEAWRP